MPLVLALEPDPRQAAALKQILERRVGAELVLADSKDSAIAVLGERVPDLILVTALLSPRDEAELNDHLRTLDGASHLQTLTIPLLGSAAAKPAKKKRGLLGALQRQTETAPGGGCDPAVFAEQIRSYIEHAQQLKAEAAASPRRESWATDARHGVGGHTGTTVDSGELTSSGSDSRGTPSRSGGASSSYWDWDAPPASTSAPVTHPTPADALFHFEDTRTANPSDDPDPDILPLKLEQHGAGVLDAGDILLRQPSAVEPVTPTMALDAEPPVSFILPEPKPQAVPEPGAEPVLALQPASADLEPAGVEPATQLEPLDVERVIDLDAVAEAIAPGPEPVPAIAPARQESGRRRKKSRGDGQSAVDQTAAVDEELFARETEQRERYARENEERERLAREAEERERLAWEEATRERAERVRLEREAEERERLAREEADRERSERERVAREAEERERLAREEVARERFERERLAREAEEKERFAREIERREQLARLEAARERAEREQLAKQAAERERAAREEAERERMERERLAREAEEREQQLAREAAERERVAREEAARERAERERLAREAEEREREAREEAARERAERERLAKEAAERERAAREEAERERAERRRLAREAEERERIAREEAARERAERERLAREVEKQERLAREQVARERAERERLAREAEERERAAREEAARERAERERLTREAEQWARLSREQAERERAEREQTASHMAARLAREEAARDASELERAKQQEAHARHLADAEDDRERLVRELAAQAQALAEAVKAAQQLNATKEVQKPARLRRARPVRAPKKKAPARKPAGGQGLQDEWGLYDPQVCGFEALYAKLEDEEKAAEQLEDAPTATELLMRARKDDRNGKGSGTALSKVRGPAPLAIWARRENGGPPVPPAVDTSPSPERVRPGVAVGPDFSAILNDLNLPGHVAAVSYGSGCRIGKVRIRARAAKKQAAGKRKKNGRPVPLIILSRRILEKLRAAPRADPDPTEPPEQPEPPKGRESKRVSAGR